MACRPWIVVFLACVGCQDEGIRIHHVKKPAPKRTLAVIVPRASETWFLKLNGEGDAVAADEQAFREFASSIQFHDGDPPLKFVAPAGWQMDTNKQNSSMRYATWRTSKNAEVFITRLGAEAAGVLPNINRWRGEVGLEPITEADASSLTTAIDVGGVKSTWVNVNGNPAKSEGK